MRGLEEQGGRTSESSASRMFHRKVAEVLDGGRDKVKARSMALDLLDQVVLEGVFKSFNAPAGCGFIDCAQTHALFSRDLSVHQSECVGVQVGERLSFRVRMVRGQPSVYGVSCPPENANHTPLQESKSQAQARTLSGMAEVLTHESRAAEWSDAALEWKYSKENQLRNGMDSLLAHTDGPGRSACEWRPSTEADDRRGMQAVLAHKNAPEVYPLPRVREVREGTFVGWKSN